MTKAEAIEKLKQRLLKNKKIDITKKAISGVIDEFVNLITNDIILRNKSFNIKGLGTFKTIKRKRTTKRNPRNGETISVSARKAPKIVFAQSLINNLKSR